MDTLRNQIILFYILDKNLWLNFILVDEVEHSLLKLQQTFKDKRRLEDVRGLFY